MGLRGIKEAELVGLGKVMQFWNIGEVQSQGQERTRDVFGAKR